MTTVELFFAWRWYDYAFLAGCFLLVFLCGLMSCRHYFYDLGRNAAYREIQTRRRLREWEQQP